jgi:hypothetical protein
LCILNVILSIETFKLQVTIESCFELLTQKVRY